MKSIIHSTLLVVILCMSSVMSCTRESQELSAVKHHVEQVFKYGQDRWSGEQTPLLADGIHLDTFEPVEYVYDGQVGVRGEGGPPNSWIMHNLAAHQNLFRTLDGLSNLTGDESYRQAAKDIFAYHFNHLRGDCGLLRWGGHQIIDLRSLEPIGHSWRPNVHNHELNQVFPYYPLMWEADEQATADFIRSHWNAHIIHWNTLEFNRHGSYNQPMGDLWNHDYSYPEPIFEAFGLTFIVSAMDLIYSASALYQQTGDEEALRWAKRLAELYVKARHPETGLGAFKFTSPVRRNQPPDGPLTGTLTWSSYGDRAENQFGGDFPDAAREGWEIFRGNLYTVPQLVQLEIAELLGEEGADFLDWTVDGLKAYAHYAYRPETNHFVPLWADGTDLSGYEFSRTGYYGPQGRVLEPNPANELFLFTYARAFRLSKDEQLWNVLRSMMQGLQLGDPGTSHQGPMQLHFQTENSDPHALFALLELHRATQHPDFLRLAEVVGENLMKRSYQGGFFLSNPGQNEARFDMVEPLALLSLEASRRGTPELVPTYSGGRGRINLKTE